MKVNSIIVRVPAVAAAAIASIALVSQVQAADSQPAARGHVSQACESAQLSAWFERQRQLADGDVDPFKRIASPAECRPGSASRANAAANGEPVQRTSAAGQQDAYAF
jgi:hypothetical protein